MRRPSWIANDKWFTFDKLEHFFGGFALWFMAKGLQADLWCCVGWVVLGAIVWEVKDTLLPYEKYGKLGGDGFSYRDLVCTVLGGLAALGYYAWRF